MFKVHMQVEDALGELRTVLESGYINEGLQVAQFQKAIAEFLKVDRLVVVNSCTSALTLALKIYGVGPGSEVITTPMTCIASNTPIINLGGTIVWADIDARTGSISPEDVERRVTRATKAIMCVAWAGTPCDLDALSAVSQKHGIPLIQDAAHALGAEWRGRSIADSADVTCYSFQAIKHLSCGDGGALVVNDPEKLAQARRLKWFGYDRDAHKDEKGEWRGQRWDADIAEGDVGYKFNMNNISAAIGLSQMPIIAGLIAAHRRNAAVYDRAFAGSDVVRQLNKPAHALSSHWVYTCMLVDNAVDRDRLIEELTKEGIGAGLVHLPNDTYSAFSASKTCLPGVRHFASRQISLPCGWWLSESDCQLIAETVIGLARHGG
jgi:dTDP-4-amino-4,6-dideoxygalactose transaminase